MPEITTVLIEIGEIHAFRSVNFEDAPERCVPQLDVLFKRLTRDCRIEAASEGVDHGEYILVIVV